MNFNRQKIYTKEDNKRGRDRKAGKRDGETERRRRK